MTALVAAEQAAVPGWLFVALIVAALVLGGILLALRPRG